jgi:hypothetical protein
MSFPNTPDEEFEQVFMNIIDLSSKDNTYKFALARFLLEYSNNHTQTHVEFSTIAEYFLKYYWLQECKSKLKQAPQVEKKPEIIKIIQREFDKPYYHHTFEEIKKDEPEKIQKCIEKITKNCFHNVTWRFQKVKYGKTSKEMKVFFDYKIKKEKHSNKKFIELDYGINLNSKAMLFLKKYNTALSKAVTLEWARFLGKLNLGVPQLIPKTEGAVVQRTSLTKYRKILEMFFKNCFYCKKLLNSGRETHVEHVIPFDYIAEDNIWNLVLVCQKCNLKKLGSLPPNEYLDELIRRNRNYKDKIPILEKSLTMLGPDFEKTIQDHYENARSHGFMILKDLS